MPDTPNLPASPAPATPPPGTPTPAPRSFGRTLVVVFDIVSVRLRFIVLMIVVGLIASQWDRLMNYYDRWTRPAQVADHVAADAIEYYCPMHPDVIRAEPGNCPKCGMPLSKRAKQAGGALPAGVLARVHLTPLKVEMGRIGTSPVAYRLLSREVRTVGVVDYSEKRRATITARVKGRLDKLHVNYVGQKVSKGDPLAEIYSPDLVVAQQELLIAVRAQREQPAAGAGADAAKALVQAAREKLLLWDLSGPQVDEIIRRGTPETHVTITAPIPGIITEKNVLEGKYVMEGESLYTIADLGEMWVQAKMFERDVAGVREGAAVEVRTTAYPNDLFAGRLAFVAYVVDPATRTVAARVEVANPEYKLKPGMYATAILRLPLGQVEVLPDGAPSAAAGLPAGTSTQELLAAYLAVAAALAADKADAAATAKLLAATERLVHQTQNLPAVVAVAAQVKALAGQPLAAQRETFRPLTAALIKLLRTATDLPAELYVAHCPMAEADWLTPTKAIANPYYGSEMLTCGGITGPLAAAASAAGETERFATGYYCPLHPDRLAAQTAPCPLDQAPLKFAKAEKVLAVPETAVIDTGTRRVVYRETVADSGTFDLVEVQLGPRAGEFFPVLAGLAAGDRVATQGAFLVDAENRLNPGAAAQYFGASGSPSASGGAHQH